MFRRLLREGKKRRPGVTRRVAACMLLAAACLPLGCAVPVPGQTNLSGRRIRVTMRFRTALEPSFYYFFLINRYGLQGTNQARGPVPVLSPGVNGGYGNGFATGSLGSGGTPISGVTDYGITDYVLFHSPTPNNGLNLYHFTTDPNTQQVGTSPVIGQPLSPNIPNANNLTDPTAARTLSFDIDMAQRVTDTTVQTQRAQEGRAIQFLQVNIIATNITPTDPTTAVAKETDSFGDTRSVTEQNSFLQIDLSQSRTYSSTDTTSLLSAEPTGDVYPTGANGNQALDLEYWSITVQPGS